VVVETDAAASFAAFSAILKFICFISVVKKGKSFSLMTFKTYGS